MEEEGGGDNKGAQMRQRGKQAEGVTASTCPISSQMNLVKMESLLEEAAEEEILAQMHLEGRGEEGWALHLTTGEQTL